MQRVFVYGSLKRGFSNHSWLEGQLFVGAFVTQKACYTMKNLGLYPGVIKVGTDHIHGEVYVVDDQCLAQLDILEEKGVIYERELVALKNHEEKCWMYFLIDEAFSDPDSLKECHVTSMAHSNFSVITWEKT